MEQLNKLIQSQFDKMCLTGKLFRVEMSGHELWNLYLSSFENDPVFRDPASSEHNCNNCNNFIRRYGNIVAVDESFKLMSIFDVEADEEYAKTMQLLSDAVKGSKITEIFTETFQSLNSLPYESCNKKQDVYQLGIAKNVKQYNKEEAEKYGIVSEGEIRTFNHFNLQLPKTFVDQAGNSIESIQAGYRDAKNVFQRAMEEISLDTLNLVKDLIIQGSLLDGQTHLYKVEQFIPLKQQYDSLTASERDNWCWVTSYKLPIAKFKNELIGVLCSELAEGEELNKACQSWNKRVDPVNYMKTTAPITQKQIAEAKKFVEENGYVESFDRRFATIDDIRVSEILHSNVGDGKIKEISLFDNVKATSTRHKRNEFDGVEEVSIETFMEKILPSCTSVELYLENKHSGNLVSLTTANQPDSKPIFKWNNNYSWTFNGNLAGKSQIKEAVKLAGGNVEGLLNFRLAWNDEAPHNDNSDLDLWASEPGAKIGFSTNYRKDIGNKRSPCSGQLDVDNTNPGSKMGVENITWTNASQMRDGQYKMMVHQYSNRGSKGFKAEIEFAGETYCYTYSRVVSGYVDVATVTLKNGNFTIEHHLPVAESVTKELYGLETNKFHKVNLICLSPNHWSGNTVGNKHYMFMLEGCKSPTSIRSFHNENLSSELLEHKRVLEVLAMTAQIPSTDKQLSGLGYNSTIRDEAIIKLSGNFRRTIKIKF